jgi:hypothetical protein
MQAAGRADPSQAANQKGSDMTITEEFLDADRTIYQPDTVGQGVQAALAVHTQATVITERTWNARTFDFDKDLGHLAAPDITLVWGGMLGGRSLVCEVAEARADYIRTTDATVAINFENTCVASTDAAVVVVAKGDMHLTYPDGTTYTEPLLASSTLRLLDGAWVFQHVHIGRSYG